MAGIAGALQRAVDYESLDDVVYAGRDVYGAAAPSAEEVVAWLRDATTWHGQRNALYRALCEAQGFRPQALEGPQDLIDVPLITSGLFKKRRVATECGRRLRWTTSSGTSGTRSLVPRDDRTLERFVGSVMHGLGEFHDGTRERRAFVLGPPAEEAGDVWFSYVLTLVELLYETRFVVRDDVVDLASLAAELEALEPGSAPFVVGSPALMWDFTRWLAEHGRRLSLGACNGVALTAGGWKRRDGDAVSRDELTAAIVDALGIDATRVRDVFNMVELNTVLFECEHHRKHVPPWVTTLVRRPADLSAADDGEEGILTFLDPTAVSYPGFVLSDDFGTAEHDACPCGRRGTTLAVSRRLRGIEERGCALSLERYRPTTAGAR